MTKWKKPAATDGLNFKRMGPLKGRFASKVAMKPTSPPSRGVLLQQPAKLCLEHDLFRKPVPTFRDHALAARRTTPAPSPRSPSAYVVGTLTRVPRCSIPWYNGCKRMRYRRQPT